MTIVPPSDEIDYETGSITTPEERGEHEPREWQFVGDDYAERLAAYRSLTDLSVLKLEVHSSLTALAEGRKPECVLGALAIRRMTKSDISAQIEVEPQFVTRTLDVLQRSGVVGQDYEHDPEYFLHPAPVFDRSAGF